MKKQIQTGQQETGDKLVAKQIITNILQFTDSDSKQAVQELIMHLNQLLRIKVIVPPMTEVMTILYQTKPKLYHATRYSLTSSSHLQMLFQIHGDPDIAQTRLADFMR